MSLQLLTAASAAPPDTQRVLGLLSMGLEPPAEAPGLPLQHLATPLLGQAGGCCHEAWVVPGSAALHTGHAEGFAWRRCGDLLFGVIELDETPFTATATRSALQAASESAYARIFRLLDAQGLPHLWRLWNYMADINRETGALERYRQFNLGRAEAFEGAARSVMGRVPAACALGLAGGPLSIAFLAGATPVLPIENPRQVSAFHYPSDYGPRPPTFSRAALAHPPGQEILFVSGTASIVGHQTVHPGDVRAQTEESLDNIEAVLAVASSRSRSGVFGLHELGYRAYVRHPADLEAVRAVVAGRVGDAAVMYLRADVCRADLLVEIEGQVVRSL